MKDFGLSFKDLVEARDSPLLPQDVLFYGIQLLTSVEKLHSTGLLHADIKPDNVLVNSITKEVNLIDFSKSFKYFNVDTNSHLPNIMDRNE